MENVTNDKWYCINCKFFKADSDDSTSPHQLGECRAAKPVTAKMQDGSTHEMYLTVKAKDWCGRFEHK